MEVFLIFPKSKQAQQELGQELAKFQSEQALKSIQNDEQFTSDPYLKNVLADLENLKIRSDVPGFVNLEGTCYGPEIEKMFEGRQTPEQTLEVMTTEGNKLLEQYRNT